MNRVGGVNIVFINMKPATTRSPMIITAMQIKMLFPSPGISMKCELVSIYPRRNERVVDAKYKRIKINNG